VGKLQVGPVIIQLKSYEANEEIDRSWIYPVTSERRSRVRYLSEQLLNLHPRMEDLRKAHLARQKESQPDAPMKRARPPRSSSIAHHH
jgi:hypothetical protein